MTRATPVGSSERARVADLSSGLRIKRRLVQNDLRRLFRCHRCESDELSFDENADDAAGRLHRLIAKELRPAFLDKCL